MNDARSEMSDRKEEKQETRLAAFTTFEEMAAWQKARELTRRVYDVTASARFRRDFGLVDQIRRASVSAMSNIAEGFERRGSREFAQFLSIAKGSLGEVRAQLYVALDQSYIDSSVFKELTGMAGDAARLVGGLARYLRQKEEARSTMNDTRNEKNDARSEIREARYEKREERCAKRDAR
jgi:four helix bundle protein